MSNWMLFVVTVLVWGSTWLAIEYQLGDVAPAVSIVYRYLLASALLFAWCAARGLRLGFDLRSHTYFALLGLLLFSLNYVLTYQAQQLITSALAAVAFSMMLWMNIVNARVFFGVRSGRAVIGGSMLGIVGIVVLFLPEVGRLSLGDSTLIGTGLAALGAFVASLGNMVSQAAQKHGLPVLQSNAWGMFYGAVLSALVAVVGGDSFSVDFSAAYLLSLGYLAVFGSIVGFGTYLTLLGRVGAAKAGYAMVAFPVVAIVLSVVVGETAPGWHLLGGGLLVLAGNIFVLRSRQRGYSSVAPPCQEMNFQSLPSRTSTSV